MMRLFPLRSYDEFTVPYSWALWQCEVLCEEWRPTAAPGSYAVVFWKKWNPIAVTWAQSNSRRGSIAFIHGWANTLQLKFMQNFLRWLKKNFDRCCKIESDETQDSRHNCGLLQEGLRCDVTFNGLYCHPLAHVLSFINSFRGESHTLFTQLIVYVRAQRLPCKKNKIRKLTTKLSLSNILSKCELRDVQQPSSWRQETHGPYCKSASFIYLLLWSLLFISDTLTWPPMVNENYFFFIYKNPWSGYKVFQSDKRKSQLCKCNVL